MSEEMKPPQRALTFTCRIDGDTARDLASSLYNMAHRIECGDVTTGTFGSPSSGGSYELVTIDKPHEKYFEELHAYLDARRAAKVAESGEGRPE